MRIVQHYRSTADKALLFLWLSCFLVLVCLPLLGLFRDEFLGNLSFSLLICSILLNLSMIVSYRTTIQNKKLARILWMGFGMALLGFILVLDGIYGKNSNKDLGIFLFYTMFICSFPTSIIASLIIGGIVHIVDKFYPTINQASDYLAILCIWGVLFASGYFQWFNLIPYLRRKLQERSGTRNREEG